MDFSYRLKPVSDLTTTHRLPRVPSVDRVAFLRSMARGKRVIHAGFCGTEGYPHRSESLGGWLHGQLAAEASELIGVDINRRGVEAAVHHGYEAVAADVRDKEALSALRLDPADVVIAGELIEHLDDPGSFLDGAHVLVKPEGHLVLTTPNAHALRHTIATLAGIETINPDHVALYSWYTLTNLVQRHGWTVRWFGTYHHSSARTARGRLVFGAQRLAARVRPFLAHGLIAACSSQDGARSRR